MNGTWPTGFVCAECGTTQPQDTRLYACPCGGSLEFGEPQPFSRDQVDLDEPSLWRYRAALPVPEIPIALTMGEGLTPLVPLRLGSGSAFAKLDFLMPSGSFKDRGSVVMLAYLARQGITEVVEDSSGNAGASLAAYTARAGVGCTIYVPAHASGGKLAQITAHGARVVRVEGTRQQVADAALEAARSTYYASHNRHPAFIEGVKTWAFEAWERLGWQAPDSVVIPGGYGASFLGAYRAFRSLVAAGAIERLPRLHLAQAARCRPIDAAARGEAWTASDQRPTIAEGIASSKPVRMAEIIRALRDSEGSTAAVAEEDILPAQHELAAQGLFVEPTSAVAAAAYRQFVERGIILPEERCVVFLSGSGLKAVPTS